MKEPHVNAVSTGTGRLATLVILLVALFIGLGSNANAQNTGPVIQIDRLSAVRISFTNAGQAGKVYYIQTGTNVTGTNWTTIGSVTADPDGICRFTNFPSGQSLFYRTMEAVNVGMGTALVSLAGDSPLSDVILIDPVSGVSLNVVGLTFIITPTVSSHIHQITSVVTNAGGGTVSAAYLYNGVTQIASAPVVNGLVTFNVTDGTAGASVPVGQPQEFMLAFDITGATASQPAFVRCYTKDVILYDDQDNLITVSGGAQGETQQFVGPGPVFSLAGRPVIARTDIAPSGSTNWVSQYTATYYVSVLALSETVNLGLIDSGFGAFGGTNAQSLNVDVLEDGVVVSGIQVQAGYSQPLGTVSSTDGKYFGIAPNQRVVIPVTYQFSIVTQGVHTYALRMKAFTWFTSSDVSSPQMSTPNLFTTGIWVTESL